MKAIADNPAEQTGENLIPGSAYATPWEHLTDELRLFDARVYLATLQRRDIDAGSPLEPFRFAAVTDEEIARSTDRLARAWDEVPEPEYEGEQASVAELLARLQSRIWDRRIASKSAGIALPLARLSELFGLDRFEEICLVMCMAAELSRRYERLFGYIQDDLTRNRPSVDLLFDILGLPASERVRVRRSFTPEGPLIRFALIHMAAPPSDPMAPLINRFVGIDERIAGFLLGYGGIDAGLRGVASLAVWQVEAAFEASTELLQLRAYVTHHFAAHGKTAPVSICLHGPDSARKQEAALFITAAAGKRLLVVDTPKLPEQPAAAEEILGLLRREAMLSNGAIFYRDVDPKFVAAHAGEAGMLTFVSSAEPVGPAVAKGAALLSIEIEMPDENKRRRAWQKHLGALNGAAVAMDPVILASQFRFTETQIEDTLEQALTWARQRQPDNPRLTISDIRAACRAQATPRLGSLARRTVPRHTWSDLVLPADQIHHLREICDQARFGEVVYGAWGFARNSTLGKGVNVLFTGAPGTGKTMSAEILANELGLELYKIDLSQVVSKYVGETEKNLCSIFHEAQGSNAILFFDEADALFGKRSEVKDAHDRYANIEIGFLLQRMEEYSGISIMATNLRKNLDEAFVRRLHFIVEFPFPDDENRLAIWRNHIPAATPSVDLDLEFLARQFQFAGGNIRNIAVSGAFRAAAEQTSLNMKHLVLATRREFEKLGRRSAAAEFGPYADLVWPRRLEGTQ